MARSSKGPGSKGNHASGGGLVARVKDWQALKGGSPVGPNSYRVTESGSTYHKPGSQNPRKGGPGKG
jgi:hypothetical protein